MNNGAEVKEADVIKANNGLYSDTGIRYRETANDGVLPRSSSFLFFFEVGSIQHFGAK